MYIRTFIKKIDGSPVFVDFEGARYIFQKNQHGHDVCFVGNQGHARRLLKMGEETYIPYSDPSSMSGPVQDMPPAHGTAGAVQQLGGVHSRTEPIVHEPLPDNPSVDEALTSGDQPEPEEVFEDLPEPKHVKALDPPQAVPVGSGQPAADIPLASTLTAEQQDAINAEAEPSEVTWVDEAVEAKVKEFKFLQVEPFKQFLDDNRDRIPGWPVSVKSEIARKMAAKIPDHDPGIEGFNPNDYLGEGSPGDS
jgi:hypothetical protein